MVIVTFILLLLNVHDSINFGLCMYCQYGVAKLFIIYVVMSKNIFILLYPVVLL